MTELEHTSEIRRLEGEGLALITKIKEGYDLIQNTLDEAREMIFDPDEYIDDTKKQIKTIRLSCPKLEKNLDRYGMVAFEIEELKNNMIEEK